MQDRRGIVYGTLGATSTLQLRQEVKLDKILALYRHLDMTDDPGHNDLNRFMIKKKKKKATLTSFFSTVITNGNRSLINVLVNF